MLIGGALGGWTKYYSRTNIIVDSNGIKDDGSGNGQFISSVFDLGSEELASVDAFYPFTAPTLKVKGSNVLGNVTSASWQTLTCPFNFRYVQYKLTNLPQSEYVEQINLGSILIKISGTVKDSSTGTAISGATVSYSSNSTTTALNQKTNFTLVKAANAAGQPPSPGSYTLRFGYEPSKTTYSITASAGGYENQTKNVTISQGGTCYYTATVNFSLTKTSSSSSSSNTSTSDSTTANEPSVTTAEFQDTTLPKIFTAKGSKTTDLSKIKDPKKVKDFTIHVPGKSKIVFKDILNLAGESTVAALKNLDKYLLMDKVGIVDLDSKTLKALNKKATITMEGLKFVRVPDVLVDGKADVKKIVNNEKYDKKTGKFTFDVNHFTVFWAVPKLIILTPTTSIIANPNADITAAVSDADATVTGSFNGTKLADMKPDENGEFVIKKISLKEGDNLLKLEAESNLGKVLALETSIPYNPNGKVDQQKPIYQEAAFLYAALSAIVIALVLGYLVYRRRKRHEKASKTKTPTSPKPVDKPDKNA